MENKKILVIDDDPAFREMVRIALMDDIPGLTIDEAGDGYTGGIKLSETKYDVILLDFKLPDGMNGLKFLEKTEILRANTPLIMITGEGNEEIAAHAFRLGATDYLVKRRNLLTKLIELVTDILSESGRERNHRSANLNTANSGIELIKKCQEGLNNLDMQTSLNGESIIMEFEKADEFIKFSSHVKAMDGVKVQETKILDKKFILSLFLLPTHFQRIGKVFSV